MSDPASPPISPGPAPGPTDLTPVMRQYHDWKRRYPDYLLLFRLGDFYELFEDDARVAASVLDIALTSRQKGEGAVPMAGVPHHAADGYIARLIRAGHRVAICDQVERPTPGKKLIRREVVRLVTPGTVTEPGQLTGREHNFLAAVARGRDRVGAALVDITTADFWVAETAEPGRLLEAVLVRRPAEVLVCQDLADQDPLLLGCREAGMALTSRPTSEFSSGRAETRLRNHFQVAALEGLGLGRGGPGLAAAGAVLGYLEETQLGTPRHLTAIQSLALDDHLILGESAVRSLEVVESQTDRGVRGSLLWAIDRTQTPMGGRLLRQWLLRPLRRPAEIRPRQAAVGALLEEPAALERLRDQLALIGDLARLASRAALGLATPRDLAAIRDGLRPLGGIRQGLAGLHDPLVSTTAQALDGVPDLAAELEAMLVEAPPLSAHEGGLIRAGFDADLDALIREAREARDWIAGLEGRERERTGISSLRVRYNRVFGYGIEVPRSQVQRVPEEYQRRQTLVGAERYVTSELREREARVLGAEERQRRAEFERFDALRGRVGRAADRLLATSRAAATLDVLAALAHVARERDYVRPTVDDSTVLEIREGRHPVLELRGNGPPFVANDLALDGAEVDMLVITGPNMAGKSTYMRQAALIVLLAQIGSFVPARAARVGAVDRVFTRIGAHDNLLRGQSTFLVEMTETAAILRLATSRSLILLDEIGRGTSTFDGLAIAWAVAEHLHDRRPGARVLFATHYHELTRLAGFLARVRNVHVAVREWRDEIVFLHTVAAGATDRSYGIQVARLAGLPAEVVGRAREILGELEQDRAGGPAAGGGVGQLPLFGPPPPHPVLQALADLEPDAMTPLEALQTLHALRKRLAE